MVYPPLEQLEAHAQSIEPLRILHSQIRELLSANKLNKEEADNIARGCWFYYLYTTPPKLNDGYFFKSDNPRYLELKKALHLTSSQIPDNDTLPYLISAYDCYFTKKLCSADPHLNESTLIHLQQDLLKKMGQNEIQHIQPIPAEQSTLGANLPFYRRYQLNKQIAPPSLPHSVCSYFSPAPKGSRDFHALLVEFIQYRFPDKERDSEKTYIHKHHRMKIATYLFVIHLIDNESTIRKLFNYSTLREMIWVELCTLCTKEKIKLDDKKVINCISTFILSFSKKEFKEYIKVNYPGHPVLETFETKMIDDCNELTKLRESLTNPSSTFWYFVKAFTIMSACLVTIPALGVGNTLGTILGETTLSYQVAADVGHRLALLSSRFDQAKCFSIFAARNMITSTTACAAAILMAGLSQLFIAAVIYGVAESAQLGIELTCKLTQEGIEGVRYLLTCKLTQEGIEGVQYLASLCIQYYKLLPEFLKDNFQDIYKKACSFMEMSPKVYSSTNEAFELVPLPDNTSPRLAI